MAGSSLVAATVARTARRRFLSPTCSLPSYTLKSSVQSWSTNPRSILAQKNPIRFFSGHQAKTGQHLLKLDELAHETSRKEAEERRKKKKEKKLAKKGKKHGGTADDDDEQNEDWDEDEDNLNTDENILPDPAQTKARMNGIFEQFVDSLKGIRGAEASADLFDSVTVDAYGSHVALNTVAQITIQSPTLAYANCFDPALAKNVATAILNQMENLNPSVEEHGQVKIPLPRVSLETRQKTAQQLKKRAEQYRTRIRGLRRSVVDVCKKGQAGKLEHVSKDEAFRVLQEIEQVTEECIQRLNHAAHKKEQEVMSV